MTQPLSLSYDPTADTQAYWLTEALLEHPQGGTFKKLVAMREADESSRVDLDALLRPPRHETNPDVSDWALQRWHRLAFDSLRMMDDEVIGGFTQMHRFLDIGFSPGGRSSYLLTTWRNSRGMAISLPPEDGGLGCAIPPNLHSRLDIRLDDITRYDYWPELSKPEPPRPPSSAAPVPAPLPFARHKFDLVLCAAYPPARSDTRPWRSTRHLVARVLLALLAVYSGGTILLELSHIESPLVARLVIAFGRIATIASLKSKIMQKKRGSFDLLARGVRIDTPDFRNLIYGLQRLLQIMTYGGERGDGRNINWGEQDLITPWKEALNPSGVKQIATQGVEIWEVQYKALKKALYSKGMDIDN